MVDKTQKKIIVALDGSTVAKNAAEVAIEIAHESSLLVDAFYIVDEPLVFDPYADRSKELGFNSNVDSRTQLIEIFERAGSETLNSLEQSCKSKGIAVNTSLLIGNVSELILENTEGAFLLALGRRGNGHANDNEYLGKNFRQIAHHARVPMIVGGDLIRPIKRVFLIYDGSDESNRAFKWARYLQESMSTTISVGLTGSGEEKNDSKKLDFPTSDEHPVIEEIKHLENQSIDKIVEAIKKCRSDMVVIGGYHHPKLLKWLVGSTVDQIIRQIALPILIA